MAKTHYHEFRRLMPDAEPDDPPFIIKARVVKGKKLVTIRLTEAILDEAIKRDGQADGQNCGGAVCVVKHKRNFTDHPVSGLVDWWRHRVYIAEPANRRTGKVICHAYAHYDQVEELMDTDAGLKKLRARVQKEGHIDITLYPIKKGKHPVSGRKTHSGPSGVSGITRKPRRGDELRLWNYTRGRAGIISVK